MQVARVLAQGLRFLPPLRLLGGRPLYCSRPSNSSVSLLIPKGSFYSNEQFFCSQGRLSRRINMDRNECDMTRPTSPSLVFRKTSYCRKADSYVKKISIEIEMSVKLCLHPSIITQQNIQPIER